MARVDFHQGEKQQMSAMFFESRGTANNPVAGGNHVVDCAGVRNYDGQYNAAVSHTWTIFSTRVN